MKFLASLVATLAVANPVPADEAAPASGETQMDTSIIMINMNRADIQVSDLGFEVQESLKKSLHDFKFDPRWSSYCWNSFFLV